MASSGMLLDGERTSGQDVRTQNVTAAMAIANVVKSSLGPVGLDKMLVDEIGDVTITNDGATILAKLDIEHPAAKVLVELAQLQDQEVGDGTTSVVIIAAELLKRANELIKKNIHATIVMSGFRLALKEAVKFIKANLVVQAESLNNQNLLNAGI
jgi:T-complex protein 1 subunit alpha